MIEVICTDADGILTDLEAYIDWMFKNHYAKIGKPLPKLVNPDAYDLEEKYEGLSKLEIKIMLLKYFKDYALNWGPRPGTFEALKQFQAEGKEVHIVTARALVMNFFFGGMSRGWFEEWLRKYDFKPGKIIYCPEKESGPAKLKACLDLNSDLMIEDKPDNCDYTLDACDTIAINTTYNKFYVPQNKKFNYYKCDTWAEITQTVKEIEKGRGK